MRGSKSELGATQIGKILGLICKTMEGFVPIDPGLRAVPDDDPYSTSPTSAVVCGCSNYLPPLHIQYLMDDLPIARTTSQKAMELSWYNVGLRCGRRTAGNVKAGGLGVSWSQWSIRGRLFAVLRDCNTQKPVLVHLLIQDIGHVFTWSD
jgi:hypothetical protein